MNPEDIKQINKMRQELMGEHYKELSEDDLKRIMSQPNSKLLTLHVAGILAGMVFIYVMETLTKKTMYFEELVVYPTFRNMGCATRIMDQMISLAKTGGINCIEGFTKKDNKIAQKFYKQLKFKDRKNIAYRLWLK